MQRAFRHERGGHVKSTRAGFSWFRYLVRSLLSPGLCLGQAEVSSKDQIVYALDCASSTRILGKTMREAIRN